MNTPDSNTGLDRELLDCAYDELNGTDVLAMRRSFKLIITELIEDKGYDPIPMIAKLLVTRLFTALSEKGVEMLDDPVECKEVIDGLIKNLVGDDFFKLLGKKKRSQ
jgi:hypothetical protein